MTSLDPPGMVGVDLPSLVKNEGLQRHESGLQTVSISRQIAC